MFRIMFSPVRKRTLFFAPFHDPSIELIQNDNFPSSWSLSHFCNTKTKKNSVRIVIDIDHISKFLVHMIYFFYDDFVYIRYLRIGSMLEHKRWR